MPLASCVLSVNYECMPGRAIEHASVNEVFVRGVDLHASKAGAEDSDSDEASIVILRNTFVQSPPTLRASANVE